MRVLENLLMVVNTVRYAVRSAFVIHQTSQMPQNARVL